MHELSRNVVKSDVVVHGESSVTMASIRRAIRRSERRCSTGRAVGTCSR